MSIQHTVFVYGSLMQGFGNHPHHLGRARYIGKGTTQSVYTMLDLGSFPAVMPNGETAIQGEVYSVNDAQLAALDRLEGHPSFYKRTLITLNDGRLVQTYILERAFGSRNRVVASGDWAEYRRGDNHPGFYSGTSCDEDDELDMDEEELICSYS